MASSRERGLVADLHMSRPAARERPRATKHVAVIAALLGFVAVLSFEQVPGTPSEGDVAAQESPTGGLNNTYRFVVYSLNHTSRSTEGTVTSFTFDASKLPFDFRELRFGEFRCDMEYCSRYYGGMSLLAIAGGAPADISFAEDNGKTIERIEYQGQPLIVLNSWEYVSKDSRGTVIDHRWGSMQIPAYDWRDGTWSPEAGIVVEHPVDMTLSSATLCILVYEPTISTDIPEFGPLAVCLGLCIMLAIIARTRRARGT